MESNKTGGIIALVIAIAVIAGGIFWFANREDDTVANETPQTNEQTIQEAAKEARDIIETAVASSDLSTLVTAVKAAGLVETLQGDGPYTVLAPTNDAFAKLPPGTVESLLLPENKTQLTNVLTYHVISGDITSNMLTNGQVVPTVLGQNLTVEITGGKVYFVDAKGGKAMVTTADVDTRNGTVHIIDSVLLPQ